MVSDRVATKTSFFARSVKKSRDWFRDFSRSGQRVAAPSPNFVGWCANPLERFWDRNHPFWMVSVRDFAKAKLVWENREKWRFYDIPWGGGVMCGKVGLNQAPHTYENRLELFCRPRRCFLAEKTPIEASFLGFFPQQNWGKSQKTRFWLGQKKSGFQASKLIPLGAKCAKYHPTLGGFSPPYPPYYW